MARFTNAVDRMASDEHARGQEVDRFAVDGQHVDVGEEHQQEHGDAEREQQRLAVAGEQRQLEAQVGERAASRRPAVGAVRWRRRDGSDTRRRNTSSRRCRPARRSASGRSCSASHAVRAATRAGVPAAADQVLPVAVTSVTGAPRRVARAAASSPAGAPKRTSSTAAPVMSDAGLPAATHRSVVEDHDVVGEPLDLVEVVGREHAR